MVRKEDIFVYAVHLPDGITEMVAPCADNCYTIYINEELSEEGKKKALRHAIGHIDRNDWDDPDVQHIESTAPDHRKYK